MSQTTCSICGALLRGGVCPNGHPQRAARREESSRRRRIFPIALILLLLGGIAYGALIWVPKNAAGQLMRPSSSEFAAALDTYRGAITSLPPGATDPQVLADLATQAASSSSAARDQLTQANLALTDRVPLDLPVVSSREPLRGAIEAKAEMLEFYASALQVVSAVERSASYLAQAGTVLPALTSLEANANEAEAVAPQTAAARAIPVADQMITDLQAIPPPDELAGFHQSLITIAQRIRDGFDALANAKGGEIGRPVVAATLKAVRDEIAAFRQTFGTASRQARGGGLGPVLEEVDALVIRITERLAALRDDGVEDITLPGQAPTSGI